MIKIKNAYKAFGNCLIFDHLDLVIDKPGLYIIQGESGTGKSTLLNMLAGFDSFDSGEVSIDSNLATIFQNYELIPQLNVKDNIFLSRNLTEENLLLLKKLNIDDLLEHYPDELSGGQKQRVGIARAFLLEPNIILCDEPTEALDIDNKIIVMDLLKQMAKHKIVIVASHDQKMIDGYADEVFRLKDHKLVSERSYISKNELITAESKNISAKEQFKLIHKILSRNTLIYSVIPALLLLCVQGLYLFEKQMFYYPDTTRAVNADILYIDANSKDVDLSGFVNVNDLKPILKLKQPQLSNQGFTVTVVPYIENDCTIVDGKIPEKGEVIINQHVAQQLGNIIGEEIEFTYMLASLQHTISFEVSGIIDEPDNNSLSIYYDYEGLMEILDEKMLDSWLTHRRYLLDYGSYYQIEVGYENMPKLFKQAENIKRVFIKNALYDQKLAFLNHLAVYQMLFTTFEVFLLIGSIVFLVIYIQKETKQYLNTCAILSSMQFSLQQIKKSYFIIKLIYFIPLLIIGSCGMIQICISIFDGNRYLNAEIIKLIWYVLVGIVILYCCILFLALNELKQERISQILKESKDL